MKLKLTSEIRNCLSNCLDMLSTPMALTRAQAKYTMTAFNSKCKYKKISRCRPRSSDYAELSHFTFQPRSQSLKGGREERA